MKILKYIIAVVFFLTSGAGYAQMIKDNSVWKFEAKKISGNNYDIIAHLSLEKGWHVYSLKPGGDGSLIPPSITVDENAKIKLSGALKEKGVLVSKNIEGTEGKVNMYSGKVDYSQRVAITGGTIVTGSYTYQVCNDNLCLPPTTKRYTIAIK